jgi:DNA-binding NarL/FixJ family response regulator
MRVLITGHRGLFHAGLGLLIREYLPAVKLLSASTLEQALREAFEQWLNLVILNLALPKGYGCVALARLKESRPSLSTIEVSTDERLEIISQCVEIRANSHVPNAPSLEAQRPRLPRCRPVAYF